MRRASDEDEDIKNVKLRKIVFPYENLLEDFSSFDELKLKDRQFEGNFEFFV